MYEKLVCTEYDNDALIQYHIRIKNRILYINMSVLYSYYWYCNTVQMRVCLRNVFWKWLESFNKFLASKARTPCNRTANIVHVHEATLQRSNTKHTSQAWIAHNDNRKAHKKNPSDNQCDDQWSMITDHQKMASPERENRFRRRAEWGAARACRRAGTRWPAACLPARRALAGTWSGPTSCRPPANWTPCTTCSWSPCLLNAFRMERALTVGYWQHRNLSTDIK